MKDETSNALSEILEELEASVSGESIAVEDVVERMGESSFASLMLVFSLISTSPASAIPGITAIVAVIVFILTVQMIAGRDHVWLPPFVMRRRMARDKVCKGIAWIRKPVSWVEKFLRPRFTWLLKKPWILVLQFLILGLTLVMPFMEIVPTSGSLASAVIALASAGLLTRDGALILIAGVLLLIVPAVLFFVGTGG
ncbi:exopolysaccharide biosynthesis protein [Pacificimonas flava]|uniref:Exopolysaccharide synthesis, ExoD n=1 Tax=Pacificimonas flava TaxID=1234595 RepID=M2U8L1_9SPHN|nr:exopolysaccharide biosynthesis protein [Pacificimonas flava]EMD84313.1 Exopolysaccharide synthesis, ExoD [Pacificimonas flava]MBB5279811.1 hypothetical protein [Pacificimonas flava]